MRLVTVEKQIVFFTARVSLSFGTVAVIGFRAFLFDFLEEE